MAIDEGRNENINHPSRGLEFDFNPVMLNGLRSRTRSRNTFLILALFATLGGLFSAFISLGLVLGNQNTFLGLVINGPLIGKTIFWAVGALDVLAILATTPWVMGGAISGEREKDTFDLLTATSMPMGRIVFGKLASGFLFMLLLLVVSLPFQCISFALGGVTLAEVWINLLILLLTALTGCMTVLFFSSLFKNSGQALVWSIFSYTFLFFAPPWPC